VALWSLGHTFDVFPDESDGSIVKHEKALPLFVPMLARNKGLIPGAPLIFCIVDEHAFRQARVVARKATAIARHLTPWV